MMTDELVVPGLTPLEIAALNQNLGQLQAVATINRTRKQYMEAKQKVQSLGIAIPPSLNSFETVLGWPYKAVKSLATRIKLGGFAIPGQDINDFGVDKIWAENRLGIEATHAHMSSLTYGPSFVVAMAGGDGEPKAVIRTLSPLSTTAVWDPVKRRAVSALTVISADEGTPDEFILYMEDEIITARFVRGRWLLERSETLGHCPVHVMAYDSSPEYPFGRSRITQGVMKMTDEAIRTSLRMEVGAEFYSAPQRYLLGADESAFTDQYGNKRTGWDAILGRMLAIGADEDGNKPTVGQFQQMSMQPHESMLKTIAAKFSGETNIPVNALGIIHENPASDAAMHTAYLDLNADAESAHEPFGTAWVAVMKDAIQIYNDGVLPEEIAMLTTKWRDPATPTKGASAAWAKTLVEAGILPADSEVTLELVGFDQVTIDRIMQHRRQAAAGTRMQQIIQAAQGVQNGTNPAAGGLPGGEQQPGDTGAAGPGVNLAGA